MDIRLNDILVMKKPHPCGEKKWLVLRVGADFRLRCVGCGHEVMTPRFKAEKNVRSIERKEEYCSFLWNQDLNRRSGVDGRNYDAWSEKDCDGGEKSAG